MVLNGGGVGRLWAGGGVLENVGMGLDGGQGLHP